VVEKQKGKVPNLKFVDSGAVLASLLHGAVRLDQVVVIQKLQIANFKDNFARVKEWHLKSIINKILYIFSVMKINKRVAACHITIKKSCI
jgi:hypothetical protein